MFSFFGATETEEPVKTSKSMADYYKALAAIVKDTRNTIKNADEDPDFKKAALVIEGIVELCKDIETVPALTAREKMLKQSQLLNEMGRDGLMDVTGDASRLLAEKYLKLLEGSLAKEFRPVDTCPRFPPFFGQSLYTEFEAGFERRKPRLEEKIKKLAKKIKDYQPAGEIKAGHMKKAV